MKIEIVHVRPIDSATPRGAIEKHMLVDYRVDDGATERLELPMGSASGEELKDAILAAIKTHVETYGKLRGVHEV